MKQKGSLSGKWEKKEQLPFRSQQLRWVAGNGGGEPLEGRCGNPVGVKNNSFLISLNLMENQLTREV